MCWAKPTTPRTSSRRRSWSSPGVPNRSLVQRSWAPGSEASRRIAQKAKVADLRRRLHERRFAEKSAIARMYVQTSPEPLHEELDRLPEPLRAPVVLCYLEEMTYQAAAQRLGLTEGTIRGRLAKARDLLRSRLGRRAERPPAGRQGHPLEFRSRRGAVPPALFAGTIRAAIQITMGSLGSIGISLTVIELTEGALTMLFVTRLKIAATVLAALGLATASAAALATQAANIALQEQPSAGAVIAPVPVTSNKASKHNRMTLEEAIKRTLRENARQIATRFEVPLARADYLESLLWSDRSTHAVTEAKPSRA